MSSADSALVRRAEQLVKAAIGAELASKGITAPPGEVDHMTARSGITRLSERQLQGLSASSDIVVSAAQEAVSRALTGGDLERLRNQQLFSTLHGTGTNPDAAAHGNPFAGNGRDGLSRYAARGRDNNGGDYHSELRSEGGFTISELRDIASARAVANQHGMGWLQPRELLQIGPQGVRKLAEASIDKPTFTRFTKDAGFAAKDAVKAVDFAKKNNLDAKEVINTLSDSAIGLSQGDPAEKQRWNKLFSDRITTTDDKGKPLSPEQIEANRKALDDALKAQEQKHPEQKPIIDKAREMTKTYRESDKKLELKDAAAIGKEVAANEMKTIAARDASQATALEPDTQHLLAALGNGRAGGAAPTSPQQAPSAGPSAQLNQQNAKVNQQPAVAAAKPIAPKV